jgi:hypothetical protein
MSWVSIDDNFYDDDDVTAKKPATICLFVCCMAYSARHETDGFVSTERIKKLHGFSKETLAELTNGPKPFLVKTDGGYQIRNFLKFNLSKDERERRRQDTKERVTRHRDKKRSETDDVTRYETGYKRESNDVSNTAPYPYPLPIPSLSPNKASFVVPSPDQISQVLRQLGRRNWEADGVRCWNHWDAMGWQTSNAEPIKSWQTAVRWWHKDHAEPPPPPPLTKIDYDALERA